MYAENIHFQPITRNNFNVTITQGIIPGMDHAFGLERQEMANRFNNGDCTSPEIFALLIEKQYIYPKNRFKVTVISKEPQDCFII